MKKYLVIGCLSVFLFSITACNQEAKNSHTHEDGSTHSDHKADTIKPDQQEFTVDSAKADTAKNTKHKHDDGTSHSH